MTDWDKLWKEYEDQWYALSSGRARWLMNIRVVGDKLNQVNKELKKELDSCAEKSWIKREKLEAIRDKLTEFDEYAEQLREHCDPSELSTDDVVAIVVYLKGKILEVLGNA